MPEPDDRVLDRLQKLLSLSHSANRYEAELASTRAAELMARYQLTEAEVRAKSREEPEEVGETEPIGDFRYADNWRWQLANGVARGLGCRAYIETSPCEPRPVLDAEGKPRFRAKLDRDGERIPMTYTPVSYRFIGLPSATSAVAYVFMWVGAEIERLCEEEYRAMPAHERPLAAAATSWRNGFKNGAAQAIANKMYAARKRTFRASSSTVAKALIRRDELAVEAFEERAGIRSTSPGATGAPSGYERGKQAGGRIDLDAAKGKLQPGSRQLKSG